MASIYDLKPRFQAILRPAMRALARAGVTPNMVTIAAVVGSVAIGTALERARERPALLLLLPSWLFARMALNAIDGMMARELNMATRTGAVLNEISDVISDLALYLPAAIIVPEAAWAVVAFSIGAVLTEFCGVLGPALGSARQYAGPMGKSDRAFLVGALALITWIFPLWLRWWGFIFWVAAALTAVTCLNRVVRILGEERT